MQPDEHPDGETHPASLEIALDWLLLDVLKHYFINAEAVKK
jgi:hypothetical protein